jgi:hypothetical protein
MRCAVSENEDCYDAKGGKLSGKICQWTQLVLPENEQTLEGCLSVCMPSDGCRFISYTEDPKECRGYDYCPSYTKSVGNTKSVKKSHSGICHNDVLVNSIFKIAKLCRNIQIQRYIF